MKTKTAQVRYRGLLYKESSLERENLGQKWTQIAAYHSENMRRADNWEGDLRSPSNKRITPNHVKKLRCQLSSSEDYLRRVTAEALSVVQSVRGFIEDVEKGNIQ